MKQKTRQKILLGLIGLGLFSVAISETSIPYRIASTIHTYKLTYQHPEPLFINCEALLANAITADVPYSKFSGRAFMTEGVYNALSHTTKSDYFFRKQWIWQLRIIHQQVDTADPRLLYLDCLLYSRKRDSHYWHVAVRQIVIYRQGDQWKAIHCIEGVNSSWFTKDAISESYVCW